MGSTISSYASSDYNVQCYMSEKEIDDAVSAAGKKAKIRDLCENCDRIVGWFFLDQNVFRKTFGNIWESIFRPICDFEVNKLEPDCKICNFIYSIRPKEEKNKDESHFRLARSTVGHMFGFRSDIVSSVFGLSNADAYKEGVAIRHLSSKADLSLVRKWIRLCDDNHADSNFDCLPKGGLLLQGFTVIDCEDGRNVLVSGTATMKYITLSYVWGAEVSDGPDQSGKLPSTLPNLIAGVIKVVIALGYRYLWIDRYCVPQNDSSGIQSHLLHNMDKIYSHSTLTIIAATTKCPSEGLASITRPRMVVQEFLRMDSVHLVQWVSNIQYEIESSVWNTRGWTYQEALLSRRRLVFTETQCYFQCDARVNWSGKHMESIDYDLKTKRGLSYGDRMTTIFSPRPKYFIKDSVMEFERQVNNYAQRKLSKESDVLPAFLGILGMGKYLNINTTSTLITGVTWHFDTKFKTPEDVVKAAVPTRRRALPTWTWCEWIHASPSLYQIKWETNKSNLGPMGRDMAHETALSLEFEGGTILPWPHEADLADLAQKTMLMGNVRYLHVVGWFTHLPIPINSNPKRSWQMWGPYGIELVTMQWLLRLAKEKGMNVTDNEEYVFKAWVYASAIEPSLYAGDSWNIVHMMLLGETSDSNTFERIEFIL
ncbi:hypothetical protein BCON_0175g00170 [Botryotinia convoluta]|uniref:Heterokaryon incompatibility domain-containing protein n=1 Tax=Botryotinia convoluta TaxID=54673 RepID=A0A4Z1HQ11_9HELO|nr:hypothetical protein BCON_0175g00170 [Botryotinia convoluta]